VPVRVAIELAVAIEVAERLRIGVSFVKIPHRIISLSPWPERGVG